MRLRSLLAVAVALLAASSPIASAETVKAAERSFTYVLERTSPDASSIKGSLILGRGGAPGSEASTRAMLAMVGVTAGRTPTVVPFFQLDGQNDAVPYVSAAGQRFGCERSGCDNIALAAFTAVPIDFTDEGGPDALSRIFIVAHGRFEPTIDLRLQGWRLERRSVDFAYVSDGDNPFTAYTGELVPISESLTVSVGADEKGSDAGSIATAQLPCSRSTGMAAGAGAGELRGGASVLRLDCTSGALEGTPALGGAHAAAATQWELIMERSLSAGVNTNAEVALLVIQLPKEPNETDAE